MGWNDWNQDFLKASGETPAPERDLAARARAFGQVMDGAESAPFESDRDERDRATDPEAELEELDVDIAAPRDALPSAAGTVATWVLAAASAAFAIPLYAGRRALDMWGHARRRTDATWATLRDVKREWFGRRHSV